MHESALAAHGLFAGDTMRTLSQASQSEIFVSNTIRPFHLAPFSSMSRDWSVTRPLKRF
jgi:phosphoribosylpyrophosphate synthetase